MLAVCARAASAKSEFALSVPSFSLVRSMLVNSRIFFSSSDSLNSGTGSGRAPAHRPRIRTSPPSGSSRGIIVSLRGESRVARLLRHGVGAGRVVVNDTPTLGELAHEQGV